MSKAVGGAGGKARAPALRAAMEPVMMLVICMVCGWGEGALDVGYSGLG